MHGRALAAVQHAELDASGVDGTPHRTTEGVNLADDLSLAHAADGRVAAHQGDGVEVTGQNRGFGAEARSGQRGLSTGMAAADHYYVEFVGSRHPYHHNTNSGSCRGRPAGAILNPARNVASRHLDPPRPCRSTSMPLNRCCTALAVWLSLAALALAAPMKALIVDGQNGHNWKETTPILKKLLEETGLFAVDVATSPAKGQDMSGFRPDFAAYKVVVLNYQGDDWPEATRKAFVDYVANGGGVVCYHFACAAFPKWKEYNRVIGVGGWGNRDETAGQYVCWRDGRIVHATDPPGKAGFHGAQQTFQIVVRDSDHPITRGLPKAFMQSADELYCRLRGPAENMTVLATAFAPKQKGGTDENEPML